MFRSHDTNAESRISLILKRSGFCILAVSTGIGFWAVLGGARSDRPTGPLCASLVAPIILFTALVLAKSVLVRLITLATTAILVFGATYIYFKSFLVSPSSLNSILLLEVPVAQTGVALILLAFVVVRERTSRRSSVPS